MTSAIPLDGHPTFVAASVVIKVFLAVIRRVGGA